METLRGKLGDLINALQKLRNNSPDPEQQEQIQKILRVLFMLWEEVIRQTITRDTPQFNAALQSLGEAEKTATIAKDDMGKVADAINDAVKAAKALDGVVKVIGPLFL